MYGQERLSILQGPGLGHGGGRGQVRPVGLWEQRKTAEGLQGADSTESSPQRTPVYSRAAVRVRSRTRSTGEESDGLLDPGSVRGRRLVSQGQDGSSRTVSSPVPGGHWGVRFAARHSLRSFQVGTDSTESSPRGPGAVGLGSSIGNSVPRASDQPSLRCDDLARGSLTKKVEVASYVGHKVTVCEEFPARCPRNVMQACLAVEFRSLCKKLRKDGSEPERDVDWEVDPMPYVVPEALQHLKRCESSPVEEGVSYSLERVGWAMSDLDYSTSEMLAAEHYARCGLLEFTSDDAEGWLKGCEVDLVRDIQNLECELQRLKVFELRALRRLEVCGAEKVEGRSLQQVAACFEGQGDESQQTDSGRELMPSENEIEYTCKEVDDDPPPLQTKTIAQEQVRRELGKWRESMGEEVESLVQKTEAVEELTDSQYSELVSDPGVSVELIPGKMVYVHKPTGRRRASMVGCGNFCEHDSSSQRADLFASGAGAESIRMMIRRCSMERSWHLVSVDVKTAFLQAPLMEMQRTARPRSQLSGSRAYSGRLELRLRGIGESRKLSMD